MICAPTVCPLTPVVNSLFSPLRGSLRTSQRPSLAPIGLAARGLMTAATVAGAPNKAKARRASGEAKGVQHLQLSTSIHFEKDKEDQAAHEPEQKQTHTSTASSAKPARRAVRRNKEALPEHVNVTDLRKVNGVGPKNEQLLLKVGLSNVASLKDRYKNEHKESTDDLKKYLQVSHYRNHIASMFRTALVGIAILLPCIYITHYNKYKNC